MLQQDICTPYVKLNKYVLELVHDLGNINANRLAVL